MIFLIRKTFLFMFLALRLPLPAATWTFPTLSSTLLSLDAWNPSPGAVYLLVSSRRASAFPAWRSAIMANYRLQACASSSHRRARVDSPIYRTNQRAKSNQQGYVRRRVPPNTLTPSRRGLDQCLDFVPNGQHRRHRARPYFPPAIRAR